MVVSEFFLGLRGGGLMLSPLDLELVQAWERRGLPVAVVCRGLRRGIEDAVQLRGPSAPTPRPLRAYRLAVEDEWTAYRRGRVGDAPPPPDERSAVVARLEAARAHLDHASSRPDLSPTRREAYRAAASLLTATSTPAGIDETEALLRRADGLLVGAWLSELTREARTTIGRRCVRHAGPRAPWIRPTDYRDALRAALVEGARDAGLLCLRGSV